LPIRADTRLLHGRRAMPRRLEILYVEDNPDDVALFKRVVRKVASSVVAVSDGAQAIDYLRRARHYSEHSTSQLPDVVFLDWQLPLVHGRDFLKWRRETPPFDSMPVIVLIGSGYQRDIQEALTLGADLSLPKLTSMEPWGASLIEILRTIGEKP
jgi:CheY-like chemotaxis protein